MEQLYLLCLQQEEMITRIIIRRKNIRKIDQKISLMINSSKVLFLPS